MPLLRSARKVRTPADAESEGPYRTRYDIAREGYEMRVAQLARALDQSTLRNYLALAVIIVLGAGLVTVAMRGGVRPIFIPYDQFGRVVEFDDLARLKDPPRRLIEAELTRWLVNVRGIYYRDRVAQLDRARAAKALLSPEAEQWLQQYFSETSRNPVELAEELSRTVELESISKDPDRNVWYLQWRELDVPPRGAHTESSWQGTLKIDFAPGRSEEAVWANPVGIRILAIEWNRLNVRAGPRPSPQTPAAAVVPDSVLRGAEQSQAVPPG